MNDNADHSSPTVLLTGAASVIGRAIAQELRGCRIIGLVRGDTAPPQIDGCAEVIPIDLTVSRMGLSAYRWRRLASEADVIVHSGALAQWGQPWERYQAVNVEGTARIVELAQTSGAVIYYLSTAMVFAGQLDTLQLLSTDNILVSYTQSKLLAEQLIRDSGVPWTVFRPASLVGDSRTGVSTAPQIVQQVAEWFCGGRAPYLPAHPDNRIDLVPLDVTAAAVARAVEAGDLGRAYWLCYGESAMTPVEMQDILIEHARQSGRAINAVPIVDPTGELPVSPADVPATSRTFLKVLGDASEMTQSWGGVLPTSLPLLRGRFGIPDASSADALRLSLKYWAGQRATKSRTVHSSSIH
jgi:nucleoside-diphosphate-sugar epimerase